MSQQDAADRKSLLRDALAALDAMQAKLDASERASREPIAIIGLACRYPGGVDSPESMWRMLRDGVDAVGDVPRDRWNHDDYYDPDPKAPGKTFVRQGGFLDHVDQFEPQFFGISPREAASLDPQQRLLLELAWESLENAGQAPDRLNGSATGVFVGITTTDYAKLIDFSDPANADVYAATGNALNAASGRIAFTLGLQGPCASVDTACSSSLVAVHMACQSLRSGESTMALAGGVNVMLNPDPLVLFSKWGMMAKDGRCKTFDASADGFVRSEGCGMIVLKRLSDAVAAGDNILALIPGSATNQDGKSSGLTVPNGIAQKAVIQKALATAGLKPEQIDYVEAHGTGTPLGDPIEIEALAAAYGPGRPADRPLMLGAIKTNIGHSESASGVAGLIKVVLSLQFGEIPPHLHVSTLTPRIPWERLPLSVPTSRTPWPRSDRPRIAGVSSFGFSGTNAHVLVSEAPGVPAQPPAADRPVHVLTLSARTDGSLRSLAARFAEALPVDDQAFRDACFTANTGRAQLANRAAVTAASAAETRSKLTALAEGKSAPGIVTGVLSSSDPPKIAFLFTGQGSQYRGMGRELYDTQPVFRAAIDRCDALLRTEASPSVVDLLYGESGSAEALNETVHTQPALFAIEFALTELWRSWGVEPSAVMGHSIGEFAAACAAGVITVEEAVRLVAARGRLMQGLPERGSMAALFCDEARAKEAIGPHASRLSIAAINGPTSIVISGATDAVETVRTALAAEGVRSELLRVSHAFHSPLMTPMLDELERIASTVQHRAPRIGIVSNVSGTWARSNEFDARYWKLHAASPVRFAESVQALYDRGYRVFVEVGPAPTLTSMARRFMSAADVRWVESLRQGRSDWAQMLDATAGLFTSGARLDWSAFDRPYIRHKIALPTYPFQRERCWVTHSPAKRIAARHDQSEHPLLGTCISPAEPGTTHVWQNEISTDRFPYIADHKVQGLPVLPATAYAEMGVAAATQVLGPGPLTLTDLDYRNPLFLPPGLVAETQVVLTEESDTAFDLRIYSRRVTEGTRGAWTFNMSGHVSRGAEPGVETTRNLDDARARCTRPISGQDFYREMAAKGNDWGPTFQGAEQFFCGDSEAISLLSVPGPLTTEIGRYVFHPAVADASGHVLTAAAPMQGEPGKEGAFVGGGIAEVRVYRQPRGTRLTSWARLRPQDGQDRNLLIGDVAVFDEDGLVGETLGARLFYLDDAQSQPPLQSVDQWMYEVVWEPASRGGEPRLPSVTPGAWLVLADDTGVADTVVATLRDRSHRVIVASHGDSWQRLTADSFEVRPADRSDLTRLFDEALSSGGCRGVVHLWSLDAQTPPSVDTIERAEKLGCASALCVIQELLTRRLDPAPIWFVTRGAVQTGADASCAFMQAPLWGFARAVAAEASAVWGGLIDLDSTASAAESAQALASEVLDADAEDQIAFRRGERLAARLQRVSTSTKPRTLTWRPDAAYLITGGLGGLAVEAAAWMASQGARRLVLLTRTPLPPRAEWRDAERSGGSVAARIAAVRRLEALGASVEVASVDIGDESAMRRFFERYAAEQRAPIRGVVHTAGILQYESLQTHTPQAMSSIMRPKTVGAWLLERALKDQPLDFLVFYSSVSAILSSPLIGSYAGANSFLDALAADRAARGLPALSINWGLWSDVGMAANFSSSRETEVSNSSTQAVSTISPRKGVEALERAMRRPHAQVAVTPIQWQAWASLYPAFARVPLLRPVMAGAATGAGTIGEIGASASAVLSAAPEERAPLIHAYVIEQVSKVLGLALERFDVNQPITEMGLDSLMAVELKNRFEADLRAALPIVRFLEGPSASQLAMLVQEDVEARLAAAPAEFQALGANYEEGEL